MGNLMHIYVPEMKIFWGLKFLPHPPLLLLYPFSLLIYSPFFFILVGCTKATSEEKICTTSEHIWTCLIQYFLKDLFVCINLCLCVHVCWCLQGPERVLNPSLDCCYMWLGTAWLGCWELNPGSLHKQQAIYLGSISPSPEYVFKSEIISWFVAFLFFFFFSAFNWKFPLGLGRACTHLQSAQQSVRCPRVFTQRKVQNHIS